MAEKPCPRCGAPVEVGCEDLSDEAVEAGVEPDMWVTCTKCDYATSLEFHGEEDSSSSARGDSNG